MRSNSGVGEVKVVVVSGLALWGRRSEALLADAGARLGVRVGEDVIQSFCDHYFVSCFSVRVNDSGAKCSLSWREDTSR